jgi:hypothetical protein
MQIYLVAYTKTFYLVTLPNKFLCVEKYQRFLLNFIGLKLICF